MSPPPKRYSKTYTANDWQLSTLLYGFDVGSSVLKDEHKAYLDTTVKPYLSSGCSIVLVGLASRTGPDGLNRTLSKARADAVEAYLAAISPTRTVFDGKIAVGETAAAIAGLRDGMEDDKWRGVLLLLQDQSKAPKPPGRHFDLLYLFDSTDPISVAQAPARDNPRTLSLPVRSGAALFQTFDELVREGMTFSAVLFETHGHSGRIVFDNKPVIGGEFQVEGKDRGWEKLFPAYTRVYFAGCNVAEGDDGWNFLERTGNALLKKAGGVTFGWTSRGAGIPSWFRARAVAGHTVHLWGSVRSVTFGAGGVKTGRFEDGESASAIEARDEARRDRMDREGRVGNKI